MNVSLDCGKWEFQDSSVEFTSTLEYEYYEFEDFEKDIFQNVFKDNANSFFICFSNYGTDLMYASCVKSEPRIVQILDRIYTRDDVGLYFNEFFVFDKISILLYESGLVIFQDGDFLKHIAGDFLGYTVSGIDDKSVNLKSEFFGKTTSCYWN